MAQYFFLATALPALEIEAAPEISYEELETLLKESLLPKDYEQIKILKRYYDILNLRALWKGEKLDVYGNFEKDALSESLTEGIGLPKYILDFSETYQTKAERLANFPLLLASFFKQELATADPFLKRYFDFERKLRLVLVGFRAKKMGRNVASELQFENPEDLLVAQIMAQKDAPEYEPPEGFEELKTLFSMYYEQPQKLYQALCRYSFDAVEEMKSQNVFSLSSILGYYIQFILVKKWQELDKEKGLEIINRILEG